MHQNTFIGVDTGLNALALKGQKNLKKINRVTLPEHPMSNRHLQRVTKGVSDIGQASRKPRTNLHHKPTTPSS